MRGSNRQKMAESLAFDTFDAWPLIERYARAGARIRPISGDVPNASKDSLTNTVTTILIAIYGQCQ